MENIWVWIWAGVILVTIVVELVTVGITAVWMTIGAIVALVMSLLGIMPALQIIVFFAISFVLIFFTRPWAIRFIERKRIRTNYEAVIGQEVRVLEEVRNDLEQGKVIYNGMEWSARAEDKSQVFYPDERARVSGISGVKLILVKI